MGELKQASTEDLIRAIKGTNPFKSNRVSSPDDVRVDVGQVHGPAFAKLTSRIQQVRGTDSACGILMVGAPGTGKSHILGRLSRWSRDNDAAFVFLHNLQASPERMPRYVLKAAISAVFALQGRGAGQSGLLPLLRTAMSRHEGALRDARGDDPADPEIAAILDLYMRISGDPDRAELTEAAADWMSGDEIDVDQARDLGRVTGRRISTQLPDGRAVERVLIVLARLLAVDDKVLVLCLDQIDNLDADQVRALMAFLHALIDHGQNLVVICAGVNTNIYRLKGEHIISEAAWDRVAEHVIELQEVSGDHAHGLIVARTGEFLRPFAGLKSLEGPRGRDSLFPLGEAWFEATFGQKLQVRPRDVVTWARDEWERVQHCIDATPAEAARWLSSWPAKSAGKKNGRSQLKVPPPLDEVIDRMVRIKVEEVHAQRMLNPASLPPDADNLTRLTTNLLSKCLNHPGYSLTAVSPEKAPKKGGAAPPFGFIISERNGRREAMTGVACLPGGHPISSAKALQKILCDKRDFDHILVVTDERRPLKLGARGKEHYDHLVARARPAFRHVALSLHQVVELDALDAVLGLARVGDLEIEYPSGTPRPVSESEAADAMHRLHLLVAHPLLHELLTEDDATVSEHVEIDPLEDDDVRAAIANFLGWRWAANATEVADWILEDHPEAERSALTRQVVRVADMMHVDGFLQSTPEAEDRYILWKGGSA